MSIHHSIDSLTGYVDEVTCECLTCKSCCGEGENPVEWTKDNRGRDVRLDEPVYLKCEACGGTGKLSEDCAMHADAYGNPLPEGGALALGGELESEGEPLSVPRIGARVQMPAAITEAA